MDDEQLRKLLEAMVKEAGSLKKWILSLPKSKRVSSSWAGVALYTKQPFPPKVAKAMGYNKVNIWRLIKPAKM